MPSGLAAGLTLLVGLCLLAGWLSAFRNRAYLGWLGLAFLCLSGFIMARARAATALEMGQAPRAAAVAQQVLLGVALLALLLSMVAAVRETRRRIREIQEGHRAAEEALLEMLQASRRKDGPAEDDSAPPGPGGA